jgi:hypothetical protein
MEAHGDGYWIVADVGPQKIKANLATAHGMRPNDARLMTAAPKMIAALREALEWTNDDADLLERQIARSKADWPDVCAARASMLRKLIAEAEGSGS